MVSVQHIQTPLGLEKGQEPENISVSFDDLFHTSVFPQLIPVTQLNIGVPCPVIVLQGRKIEILIFEKIVV